MSKCHNFFFVMKSEEFCGFRARLKVELLQPRCIEVEVMQPGVLNSYYFQGMVINL